MELPKEVVVFAIEVQDVVNFGEECTPEVGRAIAVAKDMVIQELSNA